MEMNLSGEPINAERAFVAGLVSKVVPADQLLDETHKTAAKVCILYKKFVSGLFSILQRHHLKVILSDNDDFSFKFEIFWLPGFLNLFLNPEKTTL